MKTIKLGFSDTFERCKDFFTEVLSRRFTVVRDDENPEYLIFGDANFGNSHYKFDPYKVRKVFFTGENVRPTYFTYDFAITFDHVNSPSHYRLPLYVMDMWGMVQDEWTNDFMYLKNRAMNPEAMFDAKTGFCSYVQKNPNCEVRNNFMHYLMDKAHVDCGGPHLNNIGGPLPREGGHHVKINFIRDRKFNVAFENGQHPGYVTEKILNAYYADTIPVYFGSYTIARDFNPKSMINCHEYNNYNDVFDRMRELANDKNKYCEVLSQPVFVDNIPNACTNLDLFLDWWEQNVIN